MHGERRLTLLVSSIALLLSVPFYSLPAVAALDEIETTSPLAVSGDDASVITVRYQDGLRFETANKNIILKLGGRMHLDAGVFGEDEVLESEVGKLGSGVEFRRVRLYFAGTLYDTVDFKVNWNLTGPAVGRLDTYATIKNIPLLGSLKIGHFKEPIGMEELTSSNYLMLMERPAITALGPIRNTGIMIHQSCAEGMLQWWIGGFRDADELGKGSGTDSNYNLTMRLVGTPLYTKGESVVHLGMSYSHQFRHDEKVTYKARPGVHLAPYFQSTGPLTEIDGVDLLNFEFAATLGPATIQAEYALNLVDSKSLDDPHFSAVYVTLSYFLTGEHRPYSRASGVFGRVRPKTSFSQTGMGGAWEVVGRFSHLDLRSKGAVPTIGGNHMNNVAIGLNWYLNPAVRMMANYVHSHMSGGADADMFQMRLAFAY